MTKVIGFNNQKKTIFDIYVSEQTSIDRSIKHLLCDLLEILNLKIQSKNYQQTTIFLTFISAFSNQKKN